MFFYGFSFTRATVKLIYEILILLLSFDRWESPLKCIVFRFFLAALITEPVLLPQLGTK